jgi:hypothetical protein
MRKYIMLLKICVSPTLFNKLNLVDNLDAIQIPSIIGFIDPLELVIFHQLLFSVDFQRDQKS